ncbi:MAG TPA: 3-hydroxyacyl-CoA dehydrogenase NAD-binding domain-containing protein [Xanthobacteraceae bacterium]|jgi:3-hydroxyacyl-CoA dehydrogenase/enoyl-CoA hydratase/3-hydroxybutyryl-CoA epimerase
MSWVNFKVDVDADGIALITWDSPGRSMNVFTQEVTNEIGEIIEKVATDPAIKGAVITSGKEAFSGGADLTMLENLSRTFADVVKAKGQVEANRMVFDESRKMSLNYRRLETSGKPWVAAINGTCAGGAFELALACHLRIASENEKTRVGLPEIKVGLFPGAGGTQRVPRMIPAGDALQFLFRGELLRLDRAKVMKLIDEVVPADKLIETAKAWIKNGGKGVQPWDVEGFKLPGGTVYSKAGMMTWPPANAIYRRETYDNYPAAKAILQSVFEGLQLPMNQALTVESRYFAKILRSKEAQAMIRTLFVSMQELNKGARRPASVPAKKLKKVAILGAGFMGAGIASVTAQAGLEVVLLDRDQESANKGKAHVEKTLGEQVTKGRIKAPDRDAILARINATPDYAAIAGADLVIEAVFEDRKVKEEAIKKAEVVLGDKVIFGSNTSTLPITSLAELSKRPDRFIGVHFFSPVEKMMLVELIMGKKTGDEALAVGLDYVRAIKKTPIVVNDSRGFYTSRVVGTYIREGHLMLTEGVPAPMVETVGRMAGMPVGPLSLNDEVAVDLAWKILQATKKDLGAEVIDPRQEALLEEMVVKRGRNGRKNGKGFYDYPDKGPKRLWPGLVELAGAPQPAESFDVDTLKQRFLGIQALETARCVEEGVITDVRDADVGSILGFGYAPFTGGTLSYIDGMGVANFVTMCERFAGRYGPRFEPSALLREMAKKGETFYGRFAPAAGKRAA